MLGLHNWQPKRDEARPVCRREPYPGARQNRLCRGEGPADAVKGCERRLKRKAFIGACKQTAWLPIQFLSTAWTYLPRRPFVSSPALAESKAQGSHSGAGSPKRAPGCGQAALVGARAFTVLPPDHCGEESFVATMTDKDAQPRRLALLPALCRKTQLQQGGVETRRNQLHKE
jgi:hypothetical protein